MSIQQVEIDFEGKKYSLETGRFAKSANGSVMVRCGDSMVLVTVCASETEDIEKDFLPLQVEYREKIASGGKIPGGFMKRETKPSDHEILISRLIDRPCRPLIPQQWRFETQVMATVFSYDPEVEPDTLSAVGASAALMISEIPFNGPFSEVRVGKIDGQLIINPSYEQMQTSSIDITVAGSDSAIIMVEGESKEISEDEFLEALYFAHEKIKLLNGLQKQLVALGVKEKRAYTIDEPNEEFLTFVESVIKEDLNNTVRVVTTKKERHDTRAILLEKLLEKVTEKYGEDENYTDKINKYTNFVFSKLEKDAMRNLILDDKVRLDGRKLNQIRPITCEVGVLPRTHGSALFTRGETQSLSTVTLGTKQDEQLIDGLKAAYTQNFYLHYNFPPYSTGEVKRPGISRREIGHGNLAERALKMLMPESDSFPYVVRIVSDILESNGSSSMATVCAGCLALFDAGVPLRKPVAGIAMGLIKEAEKVAILSDILGDEDHLGDMDFKVTGTLDGITACQMDIKIEGLSIDIMREALDQARNGRMHILGIMTATLPAAREDISQYAPRYSRISIPTDMIGTVIGPGGETIRGIIKETGVEINIDDDGTVTIAAVNKDASDAASKIIAGLVVKPVEGEIYNATVREIREGLGAIIEFMPKKQGLLHISQITHEHLNNVEDALKVGDKIEVKLLEITRDGKYRFSRKVLLPRPEGMRPDTRSDSRPDSRSDDHSRRPNSNYRR